MKHRKETPRPGTCNNCGLDAASIVIHQGQHWVLAVPGDPNTGEPCGDIVPFKKGRLKCKTAIGAKLAEAVLAYFGSSMGYEDAPEIARLLTLAREFQKAGGK